MNNIKNIVKNTILEYYSDTFVEKDQKNYDDQTNIIDYSIYNTYVNEKNNQKNNMERI